MSKFASSDLTAGQLNAVVKKLGGHEATLRFLRGELVVSEPVRRWRGENGVIYFTLVSYGLTSEQWIAHLEAKKGYGVSRGAKDLLLSSEFKPTNGVAYNIAVVKGELFADNDRVTKNIRQEADKRKFTTPNPEVVCLIRDSFSDQEIREMGLTWIIAMNNPIKDSDGGLRLLGVNADRHSLSTGCDFPDNKWRRNGGFAFALPQVSNTQN
jgi:hypothetical protein